MHDFREIAHLLLAGGGAMQIHDVDSLTKALARLLGESAFARTMGRRCAALCQARRGAVDRTLAVMRPYLDP
jgi:3-deoxy-D-manno-octulosonic-acid transferase